MADAQAKPLESKVVAWMREVLNAAGYDIVRRADIVEVTSKATISRSILTKFANPYDLQRFITDQLAADTAKSVAERGVVCREREDNTDEETIVFKQTLRFLKP